MVAIFLLGVTVGVLSLTAPRRGAGPVAHAQSAGCTNATFKGMYGVLGQSYLPTGVGNSSSTAPLQLAGVFVATADGAGGLTLGGFMNPNPPTGTYTVNPDCSFSVTVVVPEGQSIAIGSSAALGVLVDGGKRFYVASTDPSSPKYFIGERQ